MCYIAAVKTFTVECRWDADTKLWYVHDSNVPGLGGEAPTRERMMALVCERIPELLKLNSPDLDMHDVPVELLLSQKERLQLRC